jgi:hypothetical protein
MAWVSYRETLNRFGHHIDAEFVRASVAILPEGATAEVVVRFYPWWEHPLFKAAHAKGDKWGFSSYEQGKRDVTVRAIRPRTVRLSRRPEVIDWDFVDSHPLLWDWANTSVIYVNGPFGADELIDGVLALDLPYVRRADLLAVLDVRGHAPPLGIAVPAQLHAPVLTVFEQLGVRVFSPSAPRASDSAVAFLLEDGDYIIADDFEVDVPEFEHDPSWFDPSDDGSIHSL